MGRCKETMDWIDEETDQSMMSGVRAEGDGEGEGEGEGDEFVPDYFCDTCKTLKVDKPYHCNICNVCIDGYDHRCPWIGKVKTLPSI